jgi:hypothetical protein
MRGKIGPSPRNTYGIQQIDREHGQKRLLAIFEYFSENKPKITYVEPFCPLRFYSGIAPSRKYLRTYKSIEL